MFVFVFVCFFFNLISVCVHVGEWERYLNVLIFSAEHIRNSERHFILGDKYLPLLLQAESRSMIKSFWTPWRKYIIQRNEVLFQNSF